MTEFLKSEEFKKMSNGEIVTLTLSLMQEIEERKCYLSKNISSLDQQREDILHRLETPYRGNIGSKLIKELKNIQRSRRKLKCEMDDFNSLSSTYKTSTCKARYDKRKRKQYTVRTSILESITGDKKGEVLGSEE